MYVSNLVDPGTTFFPSSKSIEPAEKSYAVLFACGKYWDLYSMKIIFSISSQIFFWQRIKT